MKVGLDLKGEFDRFNLKRFNTLIVRALFWEVGNMRVNCFRQRRELNLGPRLRTSNKIPQSFSNPFSFILLQMFKIQFDVEENVA